MNSNWLVYMLYIPPKGLRLSPSIYTGITTDFPRRLEEHKSGNGAKYTKANPPSCGAIIESGLDRSSASKKEILYKRLKPKDKLEIFSKAILNY